jgi:transposase
MRFVPTKTPEQQSGLVLHRTRHLFVQRTSVINAIRAHLAEFGIVAAITPHILAVPDVSPDHARRQFCFRGRGACAKLRSVFASHCADNPTASRLRKAFAFSLPKSMPIPHLGHDR